ncbi:peptidylprolyl isomerase [Wandonia haliotis]
MKQLTNMKYTILIVSLLSAFSAFAQPDSQLIDKVVAKVGTNVILLSDLQSQKIQAMQENIEVTDELECTILEELLYQNLLLNQADLDSVTVTDEQVDAEMEQRLRVIEGQIGGREELEKFYGKTVSQIKKEFRPAIRKRLIGQEMERQITAEVVISPKEVRDFFHSLPEDSLPYINSKLGLQQIVIYPEITEADKQKTYDQLNTIREQIISGDKTFRAMAGVYSQDPGSRSKGGEIKASRGQMVKEFEATAFSLKPGEISPVFETEYGFHVMELIERKGDDYVCRHILMVPEVSEEAFIIASEKIEKCHAELKKNEITWEDAVLKYSNDNSTNQNKGLLSNPYSGETLWDMEDLNQIDQQIFILVNSLEVGEITRPSVYDNMMERKQGVRIVRLSERTTPHKANLKDDYQLIQNAALNEKRQKIIKEWTDDKINNAYIRIDEKYNACDFRYNWFKNIN